MIDRDTFDRGMTFFTAHYPQIEFHAHNLEAWYALLRDEMSPAVYEATVRHLARNHQYQPWENFGATILATSRSIARNLPPEREQKRLPMSDAQMAENKRRIHELAESLAKKPA
ncbi:MAG: hypothetical protein KGJ13_11145 [Patescibacteria group bacterium]|nr:hypothetical protein [Patescibacteria group bacterium]